jgi:hypothetical protein
MKENYILSYLAAKLLFLGMLCLVFPQLPFHQSLIFAVMGGVIHTLSLGIYFEGFDTVWYFLFWRLYRNKMIIPTDIGWFVPGDLITGSDGTEMLVLRRKELANSFEYNVQIKTNFN